MRKAVAVTIFAGLVILLALLFGAGWGCKSSVPPETTEVGTRETSPEESPDFLTYRNEEFGFEFQYPSAWNLRVVDVDPFDWNGNSYKLVDIQMREGGSGDYIGVYSFAIADNPTHLKIHEWLADNNRLGEALEIQDVTINDSPTGVKLRSLAPETVSPDEQAFPGTLVFSDSERNHIFFPAFGQEREILSDYGITETDLENQILGTLIFRR
jgi:hypothetical protein